ncbi:MAG: HNH endonuclease [Bacteroidia bacterium]
MSYKIKLKNTKSESVVLDDKGYKAVKGDKKLSSINFLENLRAHSSGYGIFQRCITTKKGPVYETIYLHRWLAEKFVKKPKTSRKLFLSFKNGNVQDCRIDNLEYVTMSELRRSNSNTTNKSGYRGVTKENKRYRANLYHKKVNHHLGFFKTAEEAARAYNKKSRELFGETRSLNKIKPAGAKAKPEVKAKAKAKPKKKK